MKIRWGCVCLLFVLLSACTQVTPQQNAASNTGQVQQQSETGGEQAQEPNDAVLQDGSAEHPFLIGTAQELSKVGTDSGPTGWTLFACYRLTADITVEQWVPIGDNHPLPEDDPLRQYGGEEMNYARFTGVFTGDGHTVTIRSIAEIPDNAACYDDPAMAALAQKQEYIGLFGNISQGGVVSDLVVDASVATAKEFGCAGGVAGMNNGLIQRCCTKGTITASGESGSAGGIVGTNAGTLENCYSQADVESLGKDSYAGGAVGRNFGKINACYATGTVRCDGYAGGGVVGLNEPAATVTQCVALNNAVTGLSSRVGRVAGQNGVPGQEQKAQLSENAAFAGMQGVPNDDQPDGLAGTGLTAAAAMEQKTYEGLGWGFDKTDDAPWQWGGAHYPLPVLYWQQTSSGLGLTVPAHLKQG